MPYIKQADRERYAMLIRVMPVQNPGVLNYLITKLVLSYLGARPQYSDFNEVIGVLESVKLEFYRRAVAPYEDEKIVENGDVY